MEEIKCHFTGTNCRYKDNECENRVDNILASYCASATSTSSPESSTTITNYSTTPTFTSLNFSTQALNFGSAGVNSTTLGTVIALGVLFSLSVLLLVMVTIGWVCTCLIVKKRGAKKRAAALKR